MAALQSECHLLAYRRARALDPKQCARAYFPDKRYKSLTSNMSETMSTCFEVASNIVVVALVEKTSTKIGVFFYKFSPEE